MLADSESFQALNRNTENPLNNRQASLAECIDVRSNGGGEFRVELLCNIPHNDANDGIDYECTEESNDYSINPV